MVRELLWIGIQKLERIDYGQIERIRITDGEGNEEVVTTTSFDIPLFKEHFNKVNKLIPMGRMAKKNEYNNTILFLASEASSYMNGSVIPIDGGRTTW